MKRFTLFLKPPMMVMMTTLPRATWSRHSSLPRAWFCRFWRSPLSCQNIHNLSGQFTLLCWLWGMERFSELAGFAKDSLSFVCVNWCPTG